MDMTKEHRAELTVLKKQQRELKREEDAAARERRKAFANAEKALKRVQRETAAMCRKACRVFDAEQRTINRTSAKLHSGFAKRGRAITERIAILEGRLS